MGPSGYWPSDWPVECGGNERPKAARGRGLGLEPTDRLVATTRHTGRWPVMFVQRDRGQLYLHGTSLGDGPAAAGWVERVDPFTLEPFARSGDLPTGDHEWCGSIAVHRNGDLYTVNGSHLHRLDPDCRVVAERVLPVDHAHNGLLILQDGSIVTKDIRVGDEPSTLTMLDPDLTILATVTVPEASMGRIAAMAEGPADVIYVPGSTRLFRYRWDGTSLIEDSGWQPVYRTGNRGGLAWDITLSGGRAWIMDNGNIPGIEQRFSQTATLRPPAGTGIGTDDGPIGPPPAWSSPVRLMGMALDNTGDLMVVRPTELPAGWVIAPPVVHNGVAVAWDTGNTGVAAFDVTPAGRGDMLWFQPFRTSIQPMIYPESGELVVNDFRYLHDTETSDDLVVLDLQTGRMKARVETGATRFNGMFLCPGWHRDLYYCSFGTVARIRAESL